MNFEILFLGLIQGISEILPISSSINLHFFSSIFHINDFSFSLKVSLHVGSLLTLLIYFKKEIFEILKGMFSKKTKLFETHFLSLVFGTIPVVIFGFFAKDFAKEFNSPVIMGIFSIFFGILLFVFDKASIMNSKTDKKPVSVVKSFIIGCFQTIAIFPGVSRLGICITAARMVGFNRKKAISFSLFLAIPSICGSLVLELIDLYKNNNIHTLSKDFLIGIIFTMLVGLIAIRPCIKYMVKSGFFWLSIYRIAIGIAICFL